ncbi:hypothetical protein BMR85_018935 [Achromobacter sp. KAs 3-5]|nr:hypothetical protein BMR85_018935 [Achromobacter sp. KAs 3-5]
MTTIDMLCKVGAFPDRCEASVTRTATACDGPLPPLEPQAGEQLLVGKGDRARTGILLIHRLGGAPWEMHELALGLNEQGYSVMAVKLAGHCGSLQELAGAGWMDWLASVRRGADTLASRTDRVVVGGISTGAVLALALAQERPFHVAGVLALSPVLRHDGRAGPRGASTRSTSAGATSIAPATLARSGTGSEALITQPRLWATSRTGLRASSTSAVRRDIQSAAQGFSQSCCSIRRAFGNRACHRDCQ